MKNLKDLLVHMVKDLYSAEDQMLSAYKKMTKNADSDKLKQYFEEHVETTKEHKSKLEEVAKIMDIELGDVTCDAMKGLVKEAEGFIDDHKLTPDVKDAGMIAQAQRIEHYEITGYGTVKRYAEELKMDEIKKIFDSILKDEYSQDDRLSKLAEERLNREAK